MVARIGLFSEAAIEGTVEATQTIDRAALIPLFHEEAEAGIMEESTLEGNS
jgi:hypothetical protein